MGNDVIVDFAVSILGYAPDEVGELTVAENRGLPLEIVNLLRSAPPGWFMDDKHDNARLNLIKELCRDIEWDADPSISRSREVLRCYAYETFESDNRQLVKALAWNVPEFVPGPGCKSPRRDADLRQLDQLWDVDVSPPEQLLLRSLHSAVGTNSRSEIGHRNTRGSSYLSELRQTRQLLAKVMEERDQARADLERLHDRKSVRVALKLANRLGPLVSFLGKPNQH